MGMGLCMWVRRLVRLGVRRHMVPMRTGLNAWMVLMWGRRRMLQVRRLYVPMRMMMRRWRISGLRVQMLGGGVWRCIVVHLHVLRGGWRLGRVGRLPHGGRSRTR